MYSERVACMYTGIVLKKVAFSIVPQIMVTVPKVKYKTLSTPHRVII